MEAPYKDASLRKRQKQVAPECQRSGWGAGSPCLPWPLCHLLTPREEAWWQGSTKGGLPG